MKLSIRLNTKRNVIIFSSLAIFFAAIGAYVGAKHIASEKSQSRAVSNFFALSMLDVNGVTQKLNQWKGKTLVVNFWATWCAPCVEEIPELSALQQQLAQKNTQIIGIGIDSPANILEFSKLRKISYPLFIAGMSGTDLAGQFGNASGNLPYTVIIGPDGAIKKTYLGRLKLDQLRKDLAEF